MVDRHDAVDRILGQWAAARPDVDVSPLAVIGRVSRLSRLVDRRLGANFARFDLEDWMYDVLATLRRSGEPYTLTAGELGQQSMVTSGAITNRIDRLAARGLVERVPGTDRRRVLVRLTETGRRTVDDVIGAHVAVEHEMLAGLSTAERTQLAGLLRDVLLHLGDHASATRTHGPTPSRRGSAAGAGPRVRRGPARRRRPEHAPHPVANGDGVVEEDRHVGADYEFRTVWRVAGTVAEVRDVLTDGPSLPHWWPAVYLAVEPVRGTDGDDGLVLFTKGWLPYTLRWTLRVTEPVTDTGFALTATGDLTGTGRWTFARDGPEVEITYDWRVSADKPLLRRLTWLLRPVFAANHRWAMARGEESLRLELRRRRATTEAERRRIPAPPPPTFRRRIGR